MKRSLCFCGYEVQARARHLIDCLRRWLQTPVVFGKAPESVCGPALILFPCQRSLLCCGLAGIVAFKGTEDTGERADLASLREMVQSAAERTLSDCISSRRCIDADYLGGGSRMERLYDTVRNLKRIGPFYDLYTHTEKFKRLESIGTHLAQLAASEDRRLAAEMGRIEAAEIDIISARAETLKDITWCIQQEILGNIDRIRQLIKDSDQATTRNTVRVFKHLNTVLNSVDRLEVRGRDSAGISLMFCLDAEAEARFASVVAAKGLEESVAARSGQDPLVNRGLRIRNEKGLTVISFVYKVAAEIGSLGDNVRHLRQQIAQDPVLQIVAALPARYHTVSSHTRWASVGAITEANCHPVDNRTQDFDPARQPTLHVCLNGDIDNYQRLLAECQAEGTAIHRDVTTDTKIIPLVIERHYRACGDPVEAFRRAVNEFEGSHAISMQTDLAPGKIFLAQKGSGQALFVGISEETYMPTSEVYGFVEETRRFIKIEGETSADARNGTSRGQIFVLNQESRGGIDGIQAMDYDGTAQTLGPSDIRQTAITARDIDRQQFPHYFLKEVSESPRSVEKTLQNRWKLVANGPQRRYAAVLDESVIPASLEAALGRRPAEGGIRRIYFVGQGTAGVAARACADLFDYYLDDPLLQISALKASELSGFKLGPEDDRHSMADALVIPITQSGTTTDTNRTVDMVRERGAHTLAIVNRRDSDITFKVDGVLYTSSGRDIEMSVASTKAFYSQIVAGALLGLYLARERRSPDFISDEIRHLLALPEQMRAVLSDKAIIEASAKRWATTKTYWAAVGSGPNKAAADEIRIKLSELCYKTISSDFVEDKKHIDLSSEPLIIVCAAGARKSVIADLAKDTAIFQAHKATALVICDQGEDRFDRYAADVFHVPPAPEHLAPILNTLVGHLWGYYGALAINEGSRFIYRFREGIRHLLDKYIARGLDIYEVVLEPSFRRQIAEFYTEFRRKRDQRRIPATMGFETASDLILLMKYLTGRLPVQDFELDFGLKGTASNMLNRLFDCLAEIINSMARPVDAIKHQAKTVTVGTSRISEVVEGILFEALSQRGLSSNRLTPSNVLVLKNLQNIVAGIRGSITYRIEGLDLLGEPTSETTIHVIDKDGILADIPSRVETDNRLKGTKRIIVKAGNVYIGKGRKDDRSILVIPVLSADASLPNRIAHLLLLNITFRSAVALADRIKALGGKYEHIKNIVQENSIVWEDAYLDAVEIEELFGRSAEKIGEKIVADHGRRDG